MRIESSRRQEYLDENFGLEGEPALAAVKAELVRRELDFMSISGYEARMLQFLIRAGGVRRVVEIGTLFGYSALAMAQALPDDGVIYALEKSPENFAVASTHFAKFAAAGGAKVRALNGDALALLPTIEREGPFDLVFIDADKAGYPAYLDWAERNVRRGGFIVGDNTFLFGGVYGEGSHDVGEKSVLAMKEFNLRLSDPKKYSSTLIPTEEGLTVAQRL